MPTSFPWKLSMVQNLQQTQPNITHSWFIPSEPPSTVSVYCCSGLPSVSSIYGCLNVSRTIWMTNYRHWDATAGNTRAEMANNLGEVFFWVYSQYITIIITGWWLTYPSEKYEFVSWDDEIPNWMESHKIPWFQSPPTRLKSDYCPYLLKCIPNFIP